MEEAAETHNFNRDDQEAGRGGDGELFKDDSIVVYLDNNVAEVGQNSESVLLRPPDVQTPDDDAQISLLTFPPEILLHICSFLNAKFVVKRLTLVCNAFHTLLRDDVCWKIRVRKRWPYQYPPVSVEDIDFNWKYACMEREEQSRLWSEPEKHLEHFTLNNGLFGAVDALHLMKGGSVLAAGARDGSVHLWDLSKLEHGSSKSEKEAVMLTRKLGRSWIWSLASVDQTLCVGSWDNKIQFMDLDCGGEVSRTIKCTSAILSVKYHNQMLYAGGYDKYIYIIDPRCDEPDKLLLHKRAVLCLDLDDNFMISGSEDKTICIYDRRAGRVYKRLQFKDTFPMSFSYGINQLWIGDKKGLLRLVNTSYGKFDLVQQYDVGHTGKLTGVQHNHGSLFTCSTDTTIQVFHPTKGPRLINQLKVHCQPVSRVAYLGEVLASGGTDACINIWRPRIEERWKDL